MSMPVVLVTGASGYIAGYIIQRLVAEGHPVRGTIRDLAKADALRATLGVTPDQLTLFAADLQADAGWADAAAGAEYVLHIASPIPAGVPKNEDELIVPARDGALRVLAAAVAAGARRVVMTSSTAAISYGQPNPPAMFTEANWTDPNHPDTYAYVKSKTIAERAARDWMAENGGGTEFVTVNPSLVLGPVLSADHSASIQVVEKLLSGAFPGSPRVGFPVVDVRDVADAHIRAMRTPGINGGRFLASGPWMWLADVARTLRAEMGPSARKVPTRNLPDWLVRLFALVDPQVKLVLPELGRMRACDNSHTREVLGWSPRPVADTIRECGASLLAHGVVKA